MLEIDSEMALPAQVAGRTSQWRQRQFSDAGDADSGCAVYGNIMRRLNRISRPEGKGGKFRHQSEKESFYPAIMCNCEVSPTVSLSPEIVGQVMQLRNQGVQGFRQVAAGRPRRAAVGYQ